MGVEVEEVETFLSYLWFHLTKEGSLFGSNYISFLPIVDKASHTMCGNVYVWMLHSLRAAVVMMGWAESASMYN